MSPPPQQPPRPPPSEAPPRREPPTASPTGLSSGGGALLFALTLIALGWTTVLVVTGGVDLRGLGIRFSSRDPFRPACVAALLVLAYTAAFRSPARAHLQTLRAAVERWGPLLVIAASLYVFSVALRFGCSIAAGSDSYGYVSQADLWLAGDLSVSQPIAREMPWNTPEWTFAPLGYRAAQTPGAIVPTYPPGLPILMALAKAAGGFCGPYLVVPLMGALLVWLTYRLGVRLASRTVGVAAALLLAASPAFMGQLLRPMSDVPVATLLVAAVLAAVAVPRARGTSPGGPESGKTLRADLWNHLWTGLLLSLALLVRPNLAPLALLFLAFAWLREHDMRSRLTATALLAAGLLPGVIAVAAIHTHLYGAPWKSGYGSLEELYALHYAWTNLVRYPRWLIDTQSLLIVAFLIPLMVSWRSPLFESWRSAGVSAPVRWEGRTKAAWFLGVLIGAIWLSYLFYLPFDDLDYLRFVLASIPLMLVLAVIGWQLAASRLRWESRAAVVFAVFLVTLGFEVGRIQNLVILGRWKGECAELNVAEYVSRNLPPNAVIVSMHFSGLLRHYAHRRTLRYDWLDRDWWPRALDALTAKGYRPYIVLVDWEEPKFRERFGLPAIPDAASRDAGPSNAGHPDNAPDAAARNAGPLGTVIAELGQPARARIYDPIAAVSAAAATSTVSGEATVPAVPAASPTSPSSFNPAPPSAPLTPPTSPIPSSSPTTSTRLTPLTPATSTTSLAPPPSATGKPAVISSDAACPCTWRQGSPWQ